MKGERSRDRRECGRRPGRSDETWARYRSAAGPNEWDVRFVSASGHKKRVPDVAAPDGPQEPYRTTLNNHDRGEPTKELTTGWRLTTTHRVGEKSTS
jgi:hypothetical protein